MNNSQLKIICLSICSIFLFFSCSDNNSPLTPPANQFNNPTIANIANSFSFTVSAQSFDYNKTENLNFNQDSLIYALTVSNFSGGYAVFKILDSLKNVLRVDSIASNSVIANNDLQIQIPSKVSISLSRFSGDISVALVAKQSSFKFYKNDFPNTIGDNWTYSVYDSLANELDTVKVKIIGEKVLPNSVVSKIWIYSGGNFNDTNYVAFYDDTLKVFQKNDLVYPTEQIVFPLSVGKVWGIYGDTSNVKAIENVSVNAGNFNNAYHIFRKATGLNFQLLEDVWIVPKVGIVKKNKYEYSLGPFENSHWELLNFSVSR